MCMHVNLSTALSFERFIQPVLKLMVVHVMYPFPHHEMKNLSSAFMPKKYTDPHASTQPGKGGKRCLYNSIGWGATPPAFFQTHTPNLLTEVLQGSPGTHEILSI